MLNVLEIERILWRVMEVLRANYSLDEIRDCTLKLLLFKRLSDLSSEEGQRLSVPKESHWFVIEHEQHHLAQKLNESLTLLETANPNLEGVFTNLEVNFWSRFNDETLQHIIKIFSELNLSGEKSDDLSQLAEASGWFIEKIASTGANIREIYTPQQLTTMMVRLMNPQQEISIYDPACGSGEFLAESVRFIREDRGDLSKVKIYGQAANIQECATAKTNLILHGIENSDIRLGNAIFEPCFVEDGEVRLFDIVVANPPFNLKYSLERFKEVDYSNRYPYGIPSNGNGNFLFIQHIISSLTNTGKAAVLLPRGVLFSRGEEAEIRKTIIAADLIKAVIELAPKLFYHVSIPVVIVIFDRSKSNKNKVLFIDASCEYKAGRGQNLLQHEHVERILSTYRNFQEEEGFARLVSVKEIAENKYNLSVNRYVIPPTNEKINISLEIEKLHHLEAERSKLEGRIDDYLQALGIKL